MKKILKENKLRKLIYKLLKEQYAFQPRSQTVADYGSLFPDEEEIPVDPNLIINFETSGIRQNPNWPSPSPVTLDVSTMSISSAGVRKIKGSEAFIPHVYDDRGGVNKREALQSYNDPRLLGTPTIGYGEAIFPSDPAKQDKYRPYLAAGGPGGGEGRKMTEPEASALFAKTIRRHTSGIRSQVKVPLTQNMYDALASYCYNTGPNGLKVHGVLEPLNKGDYVGAAMKIASGPTRGSGSKNSLPGLVRRRKEEASIFATGAQELSQDLGSVSGESVLLAGDSQMEGELGRELSRKLGVKKIVAKAGAGGKEIANMIKDEVKSATDGIVISFGGNDGGAGINDLIEQVKKSPIYQKDPSRIVFLGPPPAFNPTDYSYALKVFDPEGKRGYDPADWETRKKEREEYNRRIKSAVEAEGMTFINPYGFIGKNRDGSGGSKDGIHLNTRLAKKFIRNISYYLPKPGQLLS